MDIFSEVNKITKNTNKKDVTVVRVESYQLDKDPRKCTMIAHDMMNMDEQGVPKKVKVAFHDPSGKSRGIQDFANENAMMHTMPGGMVRLDKFVVRADGSYVCSHMQRIAKKDGLRADGSGNQYESAVARAWTKVYPQLDDKGNIAEIETSNNKISRGRAMVIPESAQAATVTFGDNFLDELKASAKTAIDGAPDKTKAFLLIRQEGSDKIKEIVIPNQKQNEAGAYVPMTKDEQVAIVDNLKVVKAFMQTNEIPKAQGLTIEAVPGYQMDVYGMLQDPNSGKPLANPLVQSVVNDTSRNFALPKKPGQQRPEMVSHDRPEYKLAVIGYEIPKSDASNMASLKTLGAVPGVTASPNAGLSVTPNPYYVSPQVAAAEQASHKAAEAKQADQSAPAAAPEAQAAAAAPAAAAPAAQEQQTVAAQRAPTPQEAGAQEEMTEDYLDESMSDMMSDFDIDDLEQQLASQSL